MAMRICKKCRIEKDHASFVPAKRCHYGITWRCKECLNNIQRKRHELRRTERALRFEEGRQLFARGMKKCSGCEEIQPLTGFWKNSRWPNGFSPRCKKCRSSANKYWREQNKEYRAGYLIAYGNREGVKEIQSAYRKRRNQLTPRNIMAITLRHGLARRPTVNPATIDDLMEIWRAQDGRCVISGITMTWAKGRVLPTSISLDRIDPNGGYSKDNLRLVCQAVNSFRGRMLDSEMLTMAKAIIHNMTVPRTSEHDGDADRSWIRRAA